MTNSPQASTTSEAGKDQAQLPRRCIYCGQYAELVWVHGHGQCTACGVNTDECCRGEQCGFN